VSLLWPFEVKLKEVVSWYLETSRKGKEHVLAKICGWKYRRSRQITSVHKSFLSFLFYTLCGLLHPSWIFPSNVLFFLSRHIDQYNFASYRFLSSPLYQRQLYFLMLKWLWINIPLEAVVYYLNQIRHVRGSLIYFVLDYVWSRRFICIFDTRIPLLHTKLSLYLYISFYVV